MVKEGPEDQTYREKAEILIQLYCRAKKCGKSWQNIHRTPKVVQFSSCVCVCVYNINKNK
jgi:hypothetical protein